MSKQKEFIDHIHIYDSAKEIDYIQLNTYYKVFILCKKSFNYQIDINKFLNKNLTENEIQSINLNSPNFNFKFNEFISFQKEFDIYIVDKNYLLNRGINENFIYDCKLSYAINNEKKILSFNEEIKYLIIESLKPNKLLNQNKDNENLLSSMNNNNINNFMENLSSNINNNNVENFSSDINNISMGNKVPFNINNNIKNKEKSRNEDNFKMIFPIYQNFKKFIKSLDKQADNTTYNNIYDIISLISINLFPVLPVYLIKNDQYKYCLNTLKFNEFYKFEKSKDKQERQNIINYINTLNLLNINLNIEILSQKKLLNPNSIYSFVDEAFCKAIKLPYEKYNSFEVNYFIYQNNRFLYFSNIQLLLKVNNYKENSFSLSKYDFNNNINNLNLNIMNNKVVFNNHMQTQNTQNNIKLGELNHCLGLENIGATCYMNATIQCLCHIRSLKEYFKKYKNFDDSARLTKCFCELINSLWTESYIGYFTPTNFKNLISKLNPLFEGIQANDSKDLIIFIYETMHNELNNPNINNNNLYNLNNIQEELRLNNEAF